jgi:hypothetical protein
VGLQRQQACLQGGEPLLHLDAERGEQLGVVTPGVTDELRRRYDAGL